MKSGCNDYTCMLDNHYYQLGSRIEQRGVKTISKVIIGISLLASVAVVNAGTTTNLPTDDAKVSSFAPLNNYGSSSSRGGLAAGCLYNPSFGFTAADRFYLRFALPSFQNYTEISSATLVGYHVDDWDPTDNRILSMFPAVSDVWSEASITWSSQPGLITTQPSLGIFDSTQTPVGTYAYWDLTEIVNQKYKTAGVLSIGFMETKHNVLIVCA